MINACGLDRKCGNRTSASDHNEVSARRSGSLGGSAPAGCAPERGRGTSRWWSDCSCSAAARPASSVRLPRAACRPWGRGRRMRKRNAESKPWIDHPSALLQSCRSSDFDHFGRGFGVYVRDETGTETELKTGGNGRGNACTRIRTRDQLIKSQLLYQLSYAGAPVIVFAESSAACRRSHGRPPALLSNRKTVALQEFWLSLERATTSCNSEPAPRCALERFPSPS